MLVVPTGSRPFLFLVRLVMAALAAIVGLTAMAGLTGATASAWAGAGIAAVAAATWAARSRTLTGAATETPTSIRWLFTVGAALVLAQLAVLTPFIVDANASVWPASAWRPWRSRHACVSAYWVAARMADEVPDLYREALTFTHAVAALLLAL